MMKINNEMQNKTANLKRLLDCGIVPVIRASSSEDAMKIVDAIKEGGIDIIEITMTVPDAVDVMKSVSEKFGDEVLLGAGTVLDTKAAKDSILAGAEFIVSPCLNKEVIELCKRHHKIAIPGTMSPNEILNAWQMGADIVKVFPISNLGGPKYVKAIKAPLPQILLNATGGVNLENAGEFIKAGVSVISVGAALIDKEAVRSGNFEVLTNNARKFLEEVKKAR